jgi:hypothetical protein
MERYKREAFRAADSSGRLALCHDLAAALHERLQAESDFHKGVHRLIGELRALGHDLWSFDESDDMEVWCPDYQNPSGPGIVITFRPEEVHVEWTEQT